MKWKPHTKFLDTWSILHLLVSFMLAELFLNLGIEIGYVFILVMILGLLYEFVERFYLVGRVKFITHETFGNSASDVLMEILGSLLAILGYILHFG